MTILWTKVSVAATLNAVGTAKVTACRGVIRRFIFDHEDLGSGITFQYDLINEGGKNGNGISMWQKGSINGHTSSTLKAYSPKEGATSGVPDPSIDTDIPIVSGVRGNNFFPADGTTSGQTDVPLGPLSTASPHWIHQITVTGTPTAGEIRVGLLGDFDEEC